MAAVVAGIAVLGCTGAATTPPAPTQSPPKVPAAKVQPTQVPASSATTLPAATLTPQPPSPPATTDSDAASDAASGAAATSTPTTTPPPTASSSTPTTAFDVASFQVLSEECAGAQFRLISVTGIPLGQGLPEEEGEGSIGYEYLLPADAERPIVLVSVQEASNSSISLDEIKQRFPDTTYESQTARNGPVPPRDGLAKTIADGTLQTVLVAHRVKSELEFADTHSRYGFKWSDFFPPPYTLADAPRASLLFRLDGKLHSWSSERGEPGCLTVGGN